MTNEEIKLEAIKKAYGVYWEIIKDELTSDGFSPYRLLEESEGITFEVKTMHIVYGRPEPFVRPIILRGLGSNNGWIRIEEDGSNLPTDEGCYFVHSKVRWKPFYRIDIFTGRLTNSIENGKSIFTHYQPIVKPKPPVY